MEEKDYLETEQLFILKQGEKDKQLSISQLMALAQQQLDREQQQFGDTPQLLELLEQYPDVTSLPDEVEQAIAKGVSPLEAYRRHENEQLRKKISQYEQRDKEKSSPGSLQGEGADETDELVAIFNSVFN